MPPRQRRLYGPRKPALVPGAAPMMESLLQSKVASYATDRGALHYHTHRSDRSEPGFPDSVILGNWIMIRELKGDTDTKGATTEQTKWLVRLKDRGYDADLWTPDDWRSGDIQNQINACARKRPGVPFVDLAELAKELYLISDPANKPAAAMHWDAGTARVDRALWRRHAASVQQMFLNEMPRTEDEMDDWLRAHRIAPSSTARQVIAALRADLAPTKEALLG